MDQADRELVAAFLMRRDEAAFVKLHRRHTPYLLAMAWRLTGGCDNDVEDLVESTWTRALKGLDRFAWKSALRTWLAGILINCHREWQRSNRNDAPLVYTDEIPSPSVPVELKIDLERALTKLADGYREVVVLYHVYGYRHHDIAAMLDISEATSRSQLARGLQRLRTMLQ